MKKTRRTKKSTAARVRPFWILILLLVIAAGAGGFYGASWPGFRVKKVTISGQNVVSKSEILKAASIRGADNLWLQNMTAAANRIKAIPYVDDVKIHRSFPANVSIQVTERKPYALLREGARNMLIDGHLRVLEAGVPGGDVPIFATTVPDAAPGAFLRDERVAALARDFSVLGRAHVIARSLSFTQLQELIAVMPSGIVLKLGDDGDLIEKAALIEPILSQTQSQGRRVRAIDLRAPKTPVVVFR